MLLVALLPSDAEPTVRTKQPLPPLCHIVASQIKDLQIWVFFATNRMVGKRKFCVFKKFRVSEMAFFGKFLSKKFHFLIFGHVILVHTFLTRP